MAKKNNSDSHYLIYSITTQIIINTAPKTAVKRVIKSSLPLSFLFEKSSSFPPITLLLAVADLLLCNITKAINSIEIIIN